MLEAIGAFGRGLRFPSAYEMSGPFLKRAKQKVLDRFKNHQESWQLTGCSVMTDAWTDRKGRGVMNLVVHSAHGVCFLDSVDCSAVKKDGKYVFDLVDRCIQEIGEENVVQVDNKKDIARLFRSDELNGYLKKAKGKKANKVVASEGFWKIVHMAINFFEPLANVLRRMDSDVPAMGFFHGCMLEAKKEIATRFDNNESKYRAAWDIIDKRWDNKLKTPLHLAEYYLNPYFYYPNKSSIELDGSFRAAVISCITKMFDDEDTQDSIIEELNIYQDQQGAFGHDIAVRQRRNKTFNPAKWWMNHGTTTPHLRILATRILNLTCSSSDENVYQDEDHEGAHDEPSQEPSISKAQLPAKRKRHGHPRKKKLRSLKSLLSSDLERATCASSSESEDNESMQIEASNSDSGDE
uniref:HAT transposon superfamily protein n=1 Tax=Zea mays TaxID=4577 RepID=A0A804PU12_MAIZE